MKNNREWKREFSEKLLKFGVRVIKLVNKFPKTPAGFAIASQLIRAATSIGANFLEAQDASSRRDFTQKLSIALREAKETLYWLRIVKMTELIPEDLLEKEIEEINEIVAILVSSVKSSKRKI